MKKIFFTGCFIVWGALSMVWGQGIHFVEGTFTEVLAKAKTENKKVFIDFYTVWCGPCKMMATQVFTDTEVADYFNAKFISCQINAEDKTFAAEVARYGVSAYPTLAIVDASGKLLNKRVGACDKDYFLKFAKIANGERLDFEAMYDKLKQDKNNDGLVRDFLQDAPEYLVRLSGPNRDKWELRVERVYKDYCKRKPVAEWMNPEDFKILQTYHTEATPEDEYLNYIMAHYDDVVKAVGEEPVYQFVFTLHLNLIEEQARKGDPAYLKSLDRVKGDMKPVYDNLMNFGGKEVYTGMKYLYDGYYYIYSKKDVDKYISLMDEYVKYLDGSIKAGDYLAMVNAMSEALGNKMNNTKVAEKYVEWLTAASQFEMNSDDKLNCLLMLGDCYKELKKIELAKKCYNQAYMFSLQFNNPNLSAAVQRYIKELEVQ